MGRDGVLETVQSRQGPTGLSAGRDLGLTHHRPRAGGLRPATPEGRTEESWNNGVRTENETELPGAGGA